MALFLDKLAIASPDLTALAPIPAEFTADGGNATPRLHFAGAPEGTVELAVICHDPDAPLPNGFTHWVVYGIPADASELDLSAPGVRVAPNGAGVTSWYGPQPPFGHGQHHYYFWIYALSSPVEGSPTREEFIANYADAVIEQARLVGTFAR
jgi:Raf kinase inhibitor-like YbhB/YbcL family protein